MNKNDDLTMRERMGLRVLFWILRLINPTGYDHQVKALRQEVLEESERAKREGDTG